LKIGKFPGTIPKYFRIEITASCCYCVDVFSSAFCLAQSPLTAPFCLAGWSPVCLWWKHSKLWRAIPANENAFAISTGHRSAICPVEIPGGNSKLSRIESQTPFCYI